MKNELALKATELAVRLYAQMPSNVKAVVGISVAVSLIFVAAVPLVMALRVKTVKNETTNGTIILGF